MISKIVIFSLFLPMTAGANDQSNPWSKITAPAPGPTQIIGKTDAGCIIGAASPFPDGPGYILMRTSRKRYYGHPDLIKWIVDLGQNVNQNGLGLVLVGDLSQPMGGPSWPAHASHQSGLDVDIWFYQPETPYLTLNERENSIAWSVLSEDKQSIDPKKWSNKEREILRLAVMSEKVTRIFIAPLIKKDMCEHFPGQQWIHKLRAWWGHDDHMHVRIDCPVDQASCTPQAPIPPSDSCGADLDWWFSDEAKELAKEKEESGPKYTWPTLPEECNRLILKSQTDGKGVPVN